MDNDRMIRRVSFEKEVEKLLVGKPERYKSIIQSHIDRHLSYSDKVWCDTDVVIAYMVQLDREYVSVRDDNE